MEHSLLQLCGHFHGSSFLILCLLLQLSNLYQPLTAFCLPVVTAVVCSRPSQSSCLLQVVTSCYNLLQVVTSCQKLLQNVTRCYKMLNVVTSGYKLFQVVRRFYKIQPEWLPLTGCYKIHPGAGCFSLFFTDNQRLSQVLKGSAPR